MSTPNAPLPPFPRHVTAIQAAHADLMTEIKEILGLIDLAPQMALFLAAIGDRTIISRSDVVNSQIFFGTNSSYAIAALKKKGFIREIQASADRRRRSVALTPAGLELARKIRIALAKPEKNPNARTPRYDPFRESV